MRKLLIIALLLAPLATFGQTLAGVNGDCQIGGQQTLTSGLPSTATQQIGTSNVNQGAGVQASFPLCRVTVYATGTTNKATIYSNNNPTPTQLINPFTANTDGSYTFFAAQGACYDIQISSGSVPLPYSRTLADVCLGTGGGGGGGQTLGPFTVNRLLKAGTITNPVSATCSDDGISPTACSTGLNLVGSALLESKANNSSTGTTVNLLIARDSSGNAINAQPTDANNIIGVAAFNAGTTGSVTYAVAGNFPLLFDNQTGIGDYVTLGSTSQGHDSGATQPAGRNYGRITSVNAGPGTLANVDLDMSSNGGTSSGGSGIVSPCAGTGAIFYAQAPSSTANCDILLTTDGSGNLGATSVTTHGPSDGDVQVFDSNGAADNSLFLTSSGGDSEINWLDPSNNVIGDIAFRSAFGNVRIDSQAATSARQVSLVVESDPTEIASGCPLGTNQGCILTDSPNTAWAVGQGPAAAHEGGLQWKGNVSGAVWVGTPDTVGATYALWPYNSTGTILLDTNAGIVSAANYAGTHWTDKVVAAYGSTQCSSGCTIIVPDSIADDGHATTPSIPSNVQLVFPGDATFTACTITVGRFTKIKMAGAQLQASGTNCKVIDLETQALFQVNDKFILDGVRVNCNSQTGAIGIWLGKATAQATTYNTSVENCVVGVQYEGTQFSENYNLNVFQNTTGIIIHSINPDGGGSGNTFYGLKGGSNSVGILIYSEGIQGQGGNYFINPSLLANTVAGLAVFGNLGIDDVHWYGGNPENNATGATSITVNGKVIKRAMIYANLAAVYLGDVGFQDASANPEILAENNSIIYLTNPFGFGNVGANFVQVDATSSSNIVGGIANMTGEVQNVIAYPTTLTNIIGTNGFRFTGSPTLTYNSSFPNGFTGNPQTPAVSSVGTGTTNSTATDSVYGLVTTAAHAASPGNQTSTNNIKFGNLLASPVAATEDIFLSFLIKSSVDVGTYGSCTTTGYKVYGGGSNFSDVEFCLLAGQWTRIVIYLPNQVSNTNISLTGFPLGSEGPTISYTGIEALAYNAQTPQGQYYIGLASAQGMTGPNIGNCSAVGTAASPSVAACGNASQGSFSCATNASAATCTINTTRVTANSRIFVQPSAAEGSNLSVTCNTTSDTGLTAPRLASKSAGTSFTINLGTFSTNPECFNYWVVN